MEPVTQSLRSQEPQESRADRSLRRGPGSGLSRSLQNTSPLLWRVSRSVTDIYSLVKTVIHKQSGTYIWVPSNHKQSSTYIWVPSNHKQSGTYIWVPSNHKQSGTYIWVPSNHKQSGTYIWVPSNKPL